MTKRTLLDWQALACVIHYPASRSLFEARWFEDAAMLALAAKFIGNPDMGFHDLDDNEQLTAWMAESALPAEVNAEHVARRMLKRWTDNEFARRVRRIG